MANSGDDVSLKTKHSKDQFTVGKTILEVNLYSSTGMKLLSRNNMPRHVLWRDESGFTVQSTSTGKRTEHSRI